jgi:hypothetical protein
MIRVHLFGELRRYGDQPRADQDTVVLVDAEGSRTVGEVLQRIHVPPEEVAQVFLNGRLLQTVNAMAPWLGYQLAADQLVVRASHLDAPVHGGDRLGLFPARMAMLVV